MMAGVFARLFWGDCGRAGAVGGVPKAVVPLRAFRDKYAVGDTNEIGPKIQEMVSQFLHEATPSDKKRETARA
jgi:hypothetical protein